MRWLTKHRTRRFLVTNLIAMDLYLRKVIHPQARDNYRVILKHDGIETEIGSIGIQHGSGAALRSGPPLAAVLLPAEPLGQPDERPYKLHFVLIESNVIRLLQYEPGDACCRP